LAWIKKKVRVKVPSESWPKTALRKEIKTAKLDELFTFIGHKKQNLLDDDR